MAAGSDFLRDWQAVRGDASIQYAPLPEPKAPPQPQWLKDLLEWLGEVFGPVGKALDWLFRKIGLSGPAWPWIGGVALGLFLGLLAWHLWRRRKAAPLAPQDEEERWSPEREAALGLLEDADRLAGEGRYDEATHLLLQRSIGQIAETQPELLHPSSTAREIAALPLLSDGARAAFNIIAERVERSLFALRALGPGDWQAARAAYAEFALPPRGSGA